MAIGSRIISVRIRKLLQQLACRSFWDVHLVILDSPLNLHQPASSAAKWCGRMKWCQRFPWTMQFIAYSPRLVQCKNCVGCDISYENTSLSEEWDIKPWFCANSTPQWQLVNSTKISISFIRCAAALSVCLRVQHPCFLIFIFQSL